MGTEIEPIGGTKLSYKERPKVEEEKNSGNTNNYNHKEKRKISNNSSNHVGGEEQKHPSEEKEIKLFPPEDEKEKLIIPKITVKIRIEEGLWEKEYDPQTPLNKIASDFKEGNGLENIKKNYYIDFIYNNSSLQMDSRELNSIIEEGQKEFLLTQKMKRMPGIEKNEIIEPVDYIGKPLFKPFEVYIFEIKRKTISKIKYSKEKERNYELNKFGTSSAYCNGNNNLFISGGVDTSSDKILDIFLLFDLPNKILKKKITMPIPKKNHGMIYSQNKVYIIGGNEKSTMYYDLNDNKFVEWSYLKTEKFEPSLIKYNNYIYCIDSSNKHTNALYNIENINLSEENPEWEEITPIISPDILNLNFSQKFFGLVEDKKENIIFIGGICDNDIENKEGENIYFNLQYNVDENQIERKEMGLKIYDYKEITLSEKSFLPVDQDTYVIFPDFKRRAPRVLYFHKDRNCLEMNSYHSNPRLTKLENNHNRINRMMFLGESLKDLNFNMPIKEINKPKNNNIDLGESEIPISHETNIRYIGENNGSKISDNKMKKYLNPTNRNKFNGELSITNRINFNIKRIDEKKINNPGIFEDEKDDIKKIPKKKKKPIYEVDIKGNNTDYNDGGSKKSGFIQNPNVSSYQFDTKNQIGEINCPKTNSKNEGSQNIKGEESQKNEEKETTKSQEGDNTGDGLKKKETTKSQEGDNTGDGLKKKEIKKKSSDSIDSNLNNVKISTNINDKSKEKSGTNIEMFDYDKAYSLVTFHSSVNNTIFNNFGKLNNNKEVKKKLNKKHLIQPEEVTVKSLKRSRRQFNNYEINAFIDNNNY